MILKGKIKWGNKMIKQIALIAFVAVNLSACASITRGSSQSMAVDTVPVSGAVCQLANENGQWTIASTPGSTTITRAGGPMTVSCSTEDGYAGTSSVTSTTAGATFGNILFGGIIGAAVDMSSGAAYDYPGQVVVSMRRSEDPEDAPDPAEGGSPIAVREGEDEPIVTTDAGGSSLCRVGDALFLTTEQSCAASNGSIIER